MARRPAPANTYLRGETWWGRCKIAGREYRCTLRTGDPREAKRRLKAWRTKLERQTLGDLAAPTFKAAVIRWAQEVLPQAVKPAVADRYMVSIRQLTPVFGNLRMDEITSARIGDYIGQRSQVATNATVRRDLTALSRLLAACVAWGWRDDNPARYFDRSIIRERRPPIEPPDQDAVDTFISACPPGMAEIIRLLEQTGMRESEAVTLEAWQVDWKQKTITLTRTKTSRPRTLPFVTLGGDAGIVLAQKTAQKGFLFRSSTGDEYDAASFRSGTGRVMRAVVAKQAKADAPFRRFRVHDLRHGYAIRSLRAGQGIYSLSRHLGHTSVKTTEIYLGFLTNQEAEAAIRGGGTNGGTVVSGAESTATAHGGEQ